MKNFTFKSMLVCVAFASATTAMQAQRVTFQKNDEVSRQLRETHRAIPLWADFNNDGLMDIYYSGSSWKHGWTSGGFLVKNLGNLQLEMVADFKKEMQQVQVGTNEETGEPIYEEQERTVGMTNGLPYTAFGMGSQSLDFNQDGLIDFIITNRGGNDTGTRKELVLVKNLGNYQFQKVEDEALAALPFGDNNDSYNEDQEVGCFSIGDYNKDGYPDLICEGGGQEGRFVRLLKNVEGDHFEVADVFHPLPFDVETNKLGLYKKTEATVDEDGIEIPGVYTQEPTMKPKHMSHGSVLFADFDNDGWLDIVATGYMDGDDSDANVGVQEGGDAIRFYRNLQNGEFQDVTDHLCAEGETVNDVFKRWGTEDSWLSALDFNQDGKIDLTIVGSMTGRSEKQAVLLMNVYDAETGKFAFEENAAGISPISGTTCRLATVADLNGDDYPDYVMRGWTSYEGINDWRYGISYTNGSSNYTIDWFTDNEPGEIGGHFCETMSFGDFSGDGLLDMMATNWWTNGDTCCISINTTDAVVTKPAAPTNVAATSDGSKITVTWDAASLPVSGNEPLYNLYVKNQATGTTYMIVPANAETGFQLGYAWFNSYVLSGGEAPTYTFENLPDGKYTVGVQTVSYSYAASEFATAEVEVANGISTISKAQDMQVIVSGDGILVTAATTTPVSVFSAAGHQVASGLTNTPIHLPGQGLYIIKVGHQVAKILK